MTITQAWILFAYYERLSIPQLRKVLKNWKYQTHDPIYYINRLSNIACSSWKKWDAFLAYECQRFLAIEVGSCYQELCIANN